MRALPHTIPTRTTHQRRPGHPRGLGAMPRRVVAVDLTPQAIEQVAGRVVGLLHGQQQQQQREEQQLISAGELALYLGVTRPWIYKHRHLLGGQRIGQGPKAPWRFDRQTALQALEHHQAARREDGDL
jgi:hypothetical protein